MAVAASDLGPFAREQGPPSRAAAAAAVLAAAAAATVWDRAVAGPCGLAAALAALRGLYEVAALGRRGRALARAALALGLAAAAASFLWEAERLGQVQLGEVGQAYFRRDILRVMWPAFLRGALRTLEYAALAEVFGVVLGLVLAVLAISRARWLRFPAKAYIDLFRGTPLLVQLLVISFGLPFVGIRLDVFEAGVLGLSLNSAAYVAEIFRAGIQSVEAGQMDAARSLGMPTITAMLWVVVPQAVRRVIPPLTNEFIALLKDSSLVGVLGATIAERELLRVARDGAAAFVSATPYIMASAAYLAMTVPLTRVVDAMERRLLRGEPLLSLRRRPRRPARAEA
jgi:His/Glu/Gln/Arg/opine family amino acid ABC transporter permease subunit